MNLIKKKVSLIGTNGLPANYGGFETLVKYLANDLDQDYDLYCYCSKTAKENRLAKYKNTNLIYIPFKANGWQSMIYDALSIIDSLIKHDVLIILGFSGVFAFPLKVIFRKKIIFNIGGVEWHKVRGSSYTARLEILTKKWFEKIYFGKKNDQTNRPVRIDNIVFFIDVAVCYRSVRIDNMDFYPLRAKRVGR